MPFRPDRPGHPFVQQKPGPRRGGVVGSPALMTVVQDFLKSASSPVCIDDMVQPLQFSKTSIYTIVNRLRTAKEKLVYIADWRPSGSNFFALYSWGNHPDAPRPRAQLSSGQARAMREKMVVDMTEEELQNYHYRKQLKETAKYPLVRDPLVAMLFGSAAKNTP